MDRRMLINAAHSEECRIAIVEGGALVDLEVESTSGRKLKGNIYKAKISRIEPSLQAAFIDIGTDRNGFLQINDVHPGVYRQPVRADRGHPRIQDVLEAGQEIIVQVVKEEREQKGATLTTFLSLPGRYLVLTAGSDRGGISRRINDSEQRQRLRKLSEELEIPQGIGVIVRTAGLNRSMSELSRDLSLQLKVWEQIVQQSQTAPCPTILYKDSDVAKRAIRDYFTPEVREVIIDDEEGFQQVKEFVGQVMPRYRSRIRLYDHKAPIFSHYNIEEQVIDIFKREVKLPSGGTIMIDALETLVAIDVNSGKATAGEDIEETAFRTNMEAAEIIARQLRLRDLGGLIVIDFIDMLNRRHRANVEQKMREVVKEDRARIEVGKLSRFGLLEMSRQRLRGSLTSQSHSQCPSCQGTGKVKNAETVALEVLRKIQNAIIVGHIGLVKARLPPGPAFLLLNKKRNEIVRLETTHGARIFILPDARLGSDEYEFEMEAAHASAESPAGAADVHSAAEGEEDDEERFLEDELNPAERPVPEEDDDFEDEDDDDADDRPSPEE